MLINAESIHSKAKEVVRQCGTRNTLRIAKELGIRVYYRDDFEDLLGMYSYKWKHRLIFLNSRLDDYDLQMVCGHEIGHDLFHRELAKEDALKEFVLFNMKNSAEYEANAFVAHVRIDDGEMIDRMKQGYDVVQIAAALETNINLMLIKMNELNRMGWRLNLPYVPHGDFLRNIKAEG